jgi:anti-anti-sigma factor
MALDTTAEQVEGRVPITVLALRGELDASNFQDLVATAQAHYAEGDRSLLLDLAELDFMASSGLVALHSIVRVFQGEAPDDPEAGWGALHDIGHDVSGGGTQTAVQLCAPQPPVERVLDRTGMSRLFVVHADRDTAIAAF